MNHTIPGANAGYITRFKILNGYLRRRQQVISTAIFLALGNSLTEDQRLQSWLGRGATRRACFGRLGSKPSMATGAINEETGRPTREQPVGTAAKGLAYRAATEGA